MKLTILKENLKEGLNIVGRIAQKNLSLPILGTILFEAEKNFLCLKATDLEIGIKWWLLAKVEKEGKIACPFKVLQSLTDSLGEEKITIKGDEKKLFFESDNFRAQINGLDAEDFPIIPELASSINFEIESLKLIEGLSQVVEVATTSLAKPEFSGVYFNFDNNYLKLAATDSFRLAEKTILLAGNKLPPFDFILPQRACRELINIFGGKENLVLKFFLSPNQLLVESLMTQTNHPRLHFLSRLIEGKYPDYQEIIPREFKFKVVAQKNDFLQCLKTTGLFSSRINEVKIKIDPHEQKIFLSGQNPEVGEGQGEFPARIEGEAIEASFNWRYLVEGLNQIKTKELSFSLSKEDGPAVLRPGTDEAGTDFLYLLMPLRV